MNYYLYHTKAFAIITHGVTIIMDCLLWTMYFHYLLHSNPVWSFSFIFFMGLLQALTFDNTKLKITLITLELILVGAANYLYHYYLEAHYPSSAVFGHVSLFLLLNALARVISHAPEPLPIDYLGLNNVLPLTSWYFNPSYLLYMLWPPRLLLSTTWGVASELQAGLPVRLLTSTLVLTLTRLGWADADLSMDEIKQRAENVDKEGWAGDAQANELFSWEKDKEQQKLFSWAAAHRFARRKRQGERLPKTWLSESDKLPESAKVE